MKYLIVTGLVLLGMLNEMIGQSSQQGISYQAVIRNESNELVMNQQIGVLVAIVRDTEEVYTEVHQAMSNENGLITLEIGKGMSASGDFEEIDWSEGEYSLLVSIDITGGDDYNIEVESAINAVPISIQSQNLVYLERGKEVGELTFWNGEKWVGLNHGLPGQILVVDSNGIPGWKYFSEFIEDSTTVADIDGNVYNTVQIGDQVWMKENLKTSRYNTGTAIPNVVDNETWSGLSTGAWSYYNHDENNNGIYGKLYNWYAVEGDSLCPTGWHVPTHGEWTVLTDYLGGEGIAGGKLKEVGTVHWSSPNTGATDEVGFTALPGGLRSFSGSFYDIRNSGYWWSAAPSNSNNSWYRVLLNDHGAGVHRGTNGKRHGFSVRCLRD